MSEELVKSGSGIYQNPNKEKRDEIAAAVGATGSFWRLKMAANGNAEAVTKGVCAAGDFYLDNGEMQISIGKTFDAIFYGYAPLAIDYQDGENVQRTRDESSDLFKEVAGRVQDSGLNSNAMYGVEFIAVLRQKGPKGEDIVVSMFFNNKSMRRVSGLVSSFADEQLPVTVTSKLLEKKKGTTTFRWYAPSIREADIPFDVDVSEEKINAALRTIYEDSEEISAPADDTDGRDV